MERHDDSRLLFIGLFIGALVGVIVGSIIAMQVGERTLTLMRKRLARLFRRTDKVRFDLLLQ